MEIETIADGHPVLTFTSPADWSPTTVASTQVTGGSTKQTMMVFVGCYEDGGVVVTPDHVFLLADLTLTRADRLKPGMSLFGADGGPIEVRKVMTAEYEGDVYAIATAVSWNPESLAGRLLNTNGIVTGDYLLETHFQPAP